jgi:hypothetical protein
MKVLVYGKKGLPEKVMISKPVKILFEEVAAFPRSVIPAFHEYGKKTFKKSEGIA